MNALLPQSLDALISTPFFIKMRKGGNWWEGGTELRLVESLKSPHLKGLFTFCLDYVY